ncbi:MAG: hypothetical protein WCK51_13385 [Armatimonadota bacterium]
MKKSNLVLYLQQMLDNSADGFPDFKHHNSVHVYGGDSLGVSFAPAGVHPPKPEVPKPEEVSRPCFYLYDQGADALTSFIQETRSDATLARVSPGEVRDECEIWLRERRGSPNPAPLCEENVKTILKALRARVEPREVTVHIPGVHLEGVVINVGSVRFEPIALTRERIFGASKRHIESSAHPPDQHEQLFVSSTPWIEQILPKSGCSASFEVSATPATAAELALKDIRAACSLLQVYAWFVDRREDRTRNTMPSCDVSVSMDGTVSKSETGISYNFSRRGWDEHFVLTEEMTRHLVERCFLGELSGLFLSDVNLTTTDESVRTAIWWLSRSTISIIPSEALMFAVISTERLLFPIGSQNTKDKWETRLLWLLKDESEAFRKIVASNLAQIYEARSRMVHSGITQVEMETAKLSREIAFSVLMAFCDFWAQGKSQSEILSGLDIKAKGLG